MPDDPGRLRILPAGDAAFLIALDGDIGLAMSARVHALAAALEALRPSRGGIGRGVPGHASLLVPFDPLEIAPDAAEAFLRSLGGPGVEPAADLAAAPPLEISVRYGGDAGPDLPSVAAACGRTEAEVVALHAGETYHVLLLGFAPGFAYLGMLPPALALPRRATPQASVPAGSVAIAARQTAVYPAATPGGWHIIGRTDLVTWDPGREPPALLLPGRRVRFVPR